MKGGLQGELDLKTSGPESEKWKHQSERNQATGRKLQVGQLDSGTGLGCLTTQHKYTNSPLLAPGTGSLRRRQSFPLLARVVRAAGKGAADELAPSHSVYAYPKNPPQINVAWIPAAEAAVD